MRQHVVTKQPFVVVGAQLAQAWKVLFLETRDQIGNGRGRALVLNVSERIAALSDQSFQPSRLGTGIGGGPGVATAYGVASLATAPAHHIGEHVAPGASGGDPRAETGDGAVIRDPVAVSGRFEAADECVAEADCGHGLPYPHVQTMSVQLSDGDVHLSTSRIQCCPGKSAAFPRLRSKAGGKSCPSKGLAGGLEENGPLKNRTLPECPPERVLRRR